MYLSTTDAAPDEIVLDLNVGKIPVRLPGLQLDPKIGLISGSLTISGDYQVTLTASSLGIAQGSLLIHVTTWNISKPVTTINGLVTDLLSIGLVIAFMQVSSARELVSLTVRRWK